MIHFSREKIYELETRHTRTNCVCVIILSADRDHVNIVDGKALMNLLIAVVGPSLPIGCYDHLFRGIPNDLCSTGQIKNIARHPSSELMAEIKLGDARGHIEGVILIRTFTPSRVDQSTGTGGEGGGRRNDRKGKKVV